MVGIKGEEPVKRGQVYFLSHGGPPTMFETTSEPYKAWQHFGKAVMEDEPTGLVVVSAHWENPSDESGVLVNTDVSNPLIYDFYGFPRLYYTQTFESRGDQRVTKRVMEVLKAAGLEVEGAKRGFDHGVWVPFLVAFEGKMDIPVVQVSLPGDSNPVSSARLGKALSSLRDEGYGIMGTGQLVHNLSDLFRERPMSYAAPFMNALHTALTSSKPLETTLTLFRHPLYKHAHPSPEHLLPLIVSVGATSDSDAVEELYVGSGDKLGWGMYRWR